MITSERWKQEKLGNVIDTQKGFAFKSAWYCNDGRPIVKVSDFTQDSIDASALTKIPDEIAGKYLRYELKEGDVVIQTVGSWPSNPASVVGKCIRVPRSAHNALLNQNAVRLSPKSEANNRYLYHALKAPQFSNYIVGTAQGAASQAAITLEAIRAYDLLIPSLPIQRKIASILSAYDDLIENNLRRIKILEEMAQAIYREWFVKSRFPGHEKTRMVDSPLGKIPEGWEVATISEVCYSLEDGDWIETKDQSGNDYRLLQVSNIGVGKFIETGNFRYVTEETFTRLHCTEVVPGDILISRMPKPTGRAWLVTLMPWRMITSVDVAIARANLRKANSFFLLHHLNSPENLELVEKHQTGTTRPRISRKNLAALPLALPPRSVQERFRRFAAQPYELITSLRRKNQTLQQTRDLLLPKLISGELEVSELDIKTGGHMQ